MNGNGICSLWNIMCLPLYNSKDILCNIHLARCYKVNETFVWNTDMYRVAPRLPTSVTIECHGVVTLHGLHGVKSKRITVINKHFVAYLHLYVLFSGD
jgi:hypothetical protein